MSKFAIGDRVIGVSAQYGTVISKTSPLGIVDVEWADGVLSATDVRGLQLASCVPAQGCHEIPAGQEWIQDFRMNLSVPSLTEPEHADRHIIVRNQPCAGTHWWYWVQVGAACVHSGRAETADAAKNAAVRHARLIGWLK